MNEKRTYTHLTACERYHTEVQLKQGISLSKIAAAMGRHKSTLSRELKRNLAEAGDYCHRLAQDLAERRHADKPKAVKMDDALRVEIASCILQRWSPEQISGRLKLEGKPYVSHETIYRHLLADKAAGGVLYKNLRHQAKPYRKRYGTPEGRGKIPGRVDIAERPAIVDAKTRLGDWEADTVIGKGHRGVLVTLTERVSRLTLALPVPRKEAAGVKKAIVALLEPFKDWVHTVTFDNGLEFAQHQAVAEALDCKTFFARPYHSWERGLNENHNGLLRQYFPKRSPLDSVDKREVDQAVGELNHRPRKTLGYRTPWEVFKATAGWDDKDWASVALMT